MIKNKENTKGSAFGPIMVMMDVNRLGHSLATALKNRPHGIIPVQPNRSLPVRPAPPNPIRRSKSFSSSIEEGKKKNKKNTNQNDFIEESDKRKRNEDEKNNDRGEKLFLLNCDKLSNVDDNLLNRREKLDLIDLMKLTNDKKRSNVKAKKRKSKSIEKNVDLFREKKVPKIQNDDEIIDKTKEEISSLSDKYKRIEEKDFETDFIPIIFKYRNSQLNELIKAEEKDKKIISESKKFNNTNINFKKLEIKLKKSQFIPKCPPAISIEAARAIINESKLKVSQTIIGTSSNDENILNIQKNKDDNVNQVINKLELKIGEIKNKTTISSKDCEESINKSVLPSMPILENFISNKSVPSSENQIIKEKQINLNLTDEKISNNNEPLKILQTPNENIDKSIKNNIELINNEKLNHSETNEKFVNIITTTTLLKFQIPGHLPQTITLSGPEIISDGEINNVVDKNKTESEIPVSSSSSSFDIQQTFKETDKIDESVEKNYQNEKDESNFATTAENLQDKNVTQVTDKISQSTDCHVKKNLLENNNNNNNNEITNLNNDASIQILISEDEKSKEVVENNEKRNKMDINIIKSRQNKLNIKLQKLYEEEDELKIEMSQINDPLGIMRLQQKLNCAKKKIENTQKYLTIHNSITNQNMFKKITQSRIQVRRDLVHEIPSSKSVENVLQSSSQLSNETDKDLTETNSISSETDSSSLDNESAINDKNLQVKDIHGQSDIKLNGDMIKETRENEKLIENTDTIEISSQLVNDCDIEKTLSEFIIIEKKSSSDKLNVINPKKLTNNNVEDVDNNIIRNYDNIPVTINDISKKNISTINELENSPQVNLINEFQDQTFQMLQFNNQKEIEKNQNIKKCNCSQCLLNNFKPQLKNNEPNKNSKIYSEIRNDLNVPSNNVEQIIGGNKEKTNVHLLPNYHPVHKNDYNKIPENVSGIFSKDKGGANINLSSPLQGHSALNFPTPQQYRNLTAQGYPIIAAEPNTTNQQITQWHNQQQQQQTGQKNTSVQFNPDEHHFALKQSLMVNNNQQLQKKSPAQKISNVFVRSVESLSPAENIEIPQNNSTQRINERIITEPFQTLGNFASQLENNYNYEVNNFNTTTMINNQTATTTIDNTIGQKRPMSNLYEMTNKVIDTRQSLPGKKISPQWGTQRIIYPMQQRQQQNQRISNQRQNPQAHYRRDYPVNIQNYQIYQNPPLQYPGYCGSTAYPVPSYNKQIPSSVLQTQTQNIRQYNNDQNFNDGSNMWQNQNSTMMPLAQPTDVGILKMQRKSVAAAAVQLSHQYQQPQQFLYTDSPQPISPQWQSSHAKNYNQDNNKSYLIDVSSSSNKLPLINNNSSYYKKQVNENHIIPPPAAHSNNYHQISSIPPAINLSQKIPNLRSQNYVHKNIIGNSNAVLNLGTQNRNEIYQNDGIDKLIINKKCLHCGKFGPKFNCQGCETAFYCDENCQIQNWNIHVMECRKRMPKLKKVF